MSGHMMEVREQSAAGVGFSSFHLWVLGMEFKPPAMAYLLNHLICSSVRRFNSSTRFSYPSASVL